MSNPMHYETSEPVETEPTRDQLAWGAMEALVQAMPVPGAGETRQAADALGRFASDEAIAERAEGEWAKRLARKAYAVADAMLAARGKESKLCRRDTPTFSRSAATSR